MGIKLHNSKYSNRKALYTILLCLAIMAIVCCSVSFAIFKFRKTDSPTLDFAPATLQVLDSNTDGYSTKSYVSNIVPDMQGDSFLVSDIAFICSPEQTPSTSLYVRAIVSLSGTAENAKDIINYETITPFNGVENGYKWVRFGNYYYLCNIDNSLRSINKDTSTTFKFLTKEDNIIPEDIPEFGLEDSVNMQIVLQYALSSNIVSTNVSSAHSSFNSLNTSLQPISETCVFSFYDQKGIPQNFNAVFGANVAPPEVTPDIGYQFVEWNTRADATGATIDSADFSSVFENMELYAIFEPIEINVTVIQPEHGDITPGSLVMKYGEEKDFFISANHNYYIFAVYVGEENLGAVSKYTLTAGIEDVTISADISEEIVVLDINGGTGEQPIITYNDDKTEFTLTNVVPIGPASKEFYYYSTVSTDSEIGQTGVRIDIGTSYNLSILSGISTLYATYLTPNANFPTSSNYLVIPNGTTSISGTNGSPLKNIFSTSSNTQVLYITFPRSLTTIGVSSFYGLSSLTGVSVSPNLLSIGAYAFASCASLVSYTFTPSIATIGESAFADCSSLTTLTNFTEVKVHSLTGTFKGCQSLTSVTIGNSVSQINGVFENCVALESVVLPATLRELGANSFKGATAIESITIPSTVVTLGSSAFEGCTSLSQVIGLWSTLITVFPQRAFYNCTSLSSLEAPQNLSIIGTNCFEDCTSLAKGFTKTSESRIATISSNAFKNSGLIEIAFNSYLTTVGESAFYGNTLLTKITLSNRLATIGAYAFADCTALHTVDNLGLITTLSTGVFSGCSQLFFFNIPTTLTSIGTDAFRQCSQITKLTLSENLQTISAGAFYGCHQLSYISLNSTISSAYSLGVGDSAIYMTSGDATDASGNPILWYCRGELKTSLLTPGVYTTKRGDWAYEFIEGMNVITQYLGSSDSIVVPAQIYDADNLVKIAGVFLGGLDNIINISVSEGITHVALGGMINLKRIELPSSIRILFPGGFAESTNLEEIVGFESTNVQTLPAYCFLGCSSLKTIALPSKLTRISEYAFSGCSSLESLILPLTVSAIGVSAFSDCSSLTRLYNLESLNLFAPMIFEEEDYYATYGTYEGLGMMCFNNCTSLENIVLPRVCTINIPGAEGSENTWISMFEGCSKLKTITLLGTIQNQIVLYDITDEVWVYQGLNCLFAQTSGTYYSQFASQGDGTWSYIIIDDNLWITEYNAVKTSEVFVPSIIEIDGEDVPVYGIRSLNRNDIETITISNINSIGYPGDTNNFLGNQSNDSLMLINISNVKTITPNALSNLNLLGLLDVDNCGVLDINFSSINSETWYQKIEEKSANIDSSTKTGSFLSSSINFSVDNKVTYGSQQFDLIDDALVIERVSNTQLNISGINYPLEVGVATVGGVQYDLSGALIIGTQTVSMTNNEVNFSYGTTTSNGIRSYYLSVNGYSRATSNTPVFNYGSVTIDFSTSGKVVFNGISFTTDNFIISRVNETTLDVSGTTFTMVNGKWNVGGTEISWHWDGKLRINYNTITLVDNKATIRYDELNSIVYLVRVCDVSTLQYSGIYTLYPNSETGYFEEILGDWKFAYMPVYGGWTVMEYLGESEIITIPTSFTYQGRILNVSTFGNTGTNPHVKIINVPEGIKAIGLGITNEVQTMELENLEILNIAASVTKIESFCFRELTRLREVNFAENSQCVSIGDGAFYSDVLLSKINMPESLEVIGADAFYSNAMRALYLPDGLAAIGSQAFMLCYYLKTISIPESLVSLGSYAFMYDGAIESVEIRGDLSITLTINLPLTSMKDGVEFYYNGSSEKISILSKGGIYLTYDCQSSSEWQITKENDKNYITGYTGNKKVIHVPYYTLDKATNQMIKIYGVRNIGKKDISKIKIHEGIIEVGINDSTNLVGGGGSTCAVIVLPETATIIHNGIFKDYPRLEGLFVRNNLDTAINPTIINASAWYKNGTGSAVNQISSNGYYSTYKVIYSQWTECFVPYYSAIVSTTLASDMTYDLVIPSFYYDEAKDFVYEVERVIPFTKSFRTITMREGIEVVGFEFENLLTLMSVGYDLFNTYKMGSEEKIEQIDVDGSFESYDSGFSSGFNNQLSSGAYSVSTEKAFEGNKSIKTLRTSNSGSTNNINFYQDISNGIYELSCYVYSSSTFTSPISLMIQDDTNYTTEVKYNSTDYTTANSWQKIIISFEVNKGNTFAKIFLNNPLLNNAAYFDCLSLVKIDAGLPSSLSVIGGGGLGRIDKLNLSDTNVERVYYGGLAETANGQASNRDGLYYETLFTSDNIVYVSESMYHYNQSSNTFTLVDGTECKPWSFNSSTKVLTYNAGDHSLTEKAAGTGLFVGSGFVYNSIINAITETPYGLNGNILYQWSFDSGTRIMTFGSHQLLMTLTEGIYTAPWFTYNSQNNTLSYFYNEETYNYTFNKETATLTYNNTAIQMVYCDDGIYRGQSYVYNYYTHSLVLPNKTKLSPWEAILSSNPAYFKFNITSGIVVPSSLKKVDIGGLTTLGKHIYNLENTQITKLEYGSLLSNNSKLTEIYLPSELNGFLDPSLISGLLGGVEATPETKISLTFTVSRSIENIFISSNNNYYKSINGVLFSKDGTSLLAFPTAKTGTYTVPSATKTIKGAAFYNSQLSSVILNTELENIESQAFENSNITEYSGLKDTNVVFIGARAFAITRAKAFIFPVTLEKIGENALVGTSRNGPNTYIERITMLNSLAVTHLTPTEYYFNGEIKTKALKDAGFYTLNQEVADDWGYETIDGKVWLNSYNGTITDIIVPAYIYTQELSLLEVYGLKSINFDNATSITVESGVKAFGVSDGNNILGTSTNNTLVGITLPSSVNSLGATALAGCSSLLFITLAGELPFDIDLSNTGTIQWYHYPIGGTINITTSIKDSGSYSKEELQSGELWEITDNAITQYNGTDTDIVVPSIVLNSDGSISTVHTLSSMGSGTSVDNLTSIVVSPGIRTLSSATSVGYSVFNHCGNCENLVLPDTVTNIGDYSLMNLSKITNLIIPKNVTTIGNYALPLSSLKSIELKNDLHTKYANISGNGNWFFNGDLVSVTALYTKGLYEKLSYTIRMFGAGGSTSSNQKVVDNNNYTQGRTYSLPSNPFTRIGYDVFRGWSDTETGTTIAYNNNGSIIVGNGTNIVNRDYVKNLWALWEPNTYRVQYNANGGTGSMAFSSINYGTNSNLRSNSFTRPGYIFMGWARSPDGSPQFANGELVYNLTAVNDGIINLYAVWDNNATYSIVFVSNGGTPCDTIIGNYNSNISIPISEREGYTFGAWYYNSDLSGTTLPMSTNSMPDLSAYSNGVLTVYASWIYANYTVTFDAAGGNIDSYSSRWTGSGSKATRVFTYMSSFTLNYYVPYPSYISWSGHTFDGWYSEPAGGVKVFESANGALIADVPGFSNSQRVWIHPRNVTLYAHWIPTIYTVTLNNQSATTPGTSTIYYIYGEGYFLDAAATQKITTTTNGITCPTKTSYTFMGYSVSTSTYANRPISDKGYMATNYTWPTAATHTLYAIWVTGNIYTIVLDNHEATTITQYEIYLKYSTSYYKDYVCITPLTSITIPVKRGYAFNGFYVNENGQGTQYISSTGTLVNATNTTFNSDTTLHAYWTPKSFTLTLDNQSADTAGTAEIYAKFNDGYYLNNDFTSKIQTNANCITIPAKNGQTFYGYYSSTNGSGTQIIGSTGYLAEEIDATEFVQSVVLYAYWQPTVYVISLDNVSATVPGSTTIYIKYNTGTYANSSCDRVMNSTTNPIVTPTKTNYTFSGYFTQQNGNGIEYITRDGYLTDYAVSNTTINSGFTLYAFWVSGEVIRVLLDNGTTTINGTEIIYENYTSNKFYLNPGCSIELTSSNNPINYPIKNGYTLQGYYTGENGTGDQILTGNGYLKIGVIGNVFSETTTIYAHWVANTHTITFIPNGGSVSPTTKQVTYGEPYGVLPTPTKQNYTLKKWTVLPEEYQQVDSITTVDGAYIDTGIIPTVNTGIFLKTKLSSVADDGLYLYGGGGSQYNDRAFECYPWNGALQFNYGSSYLFLGTPIVNQIMNIYKNKAITKYSMNSSEFYHGKNIVNTFTSVTTLTLFALNRTGGPLPSANPITLYECIMWDNGTAVRNYIPCYRKSDNTIGLFDVVNGVFYTTSRGSFTKGNNVTINTLSSMVNIDSNYNLYANWEGTVYTLSLDAQGATDQGQSAIYEKYNTGLYRDLSCSYSLSDYSITIPIKTGYDFAGYFTEPNGEGAQYILANGLKTDEVGYTAFTTNSTLYAHWTPKTITITLNNLSANVYGTSTIYEKYTVGYYSDSACLNPMTNSSNPISVPSKEHYIFGGYYLAQNGESNQVILASGYLVSSLSLTLFSSNRSIYAYWIPEVYTITLNHQGGTGTTSTIYEKYNTGFFLDSACTQLMTIASNPIVSPTLAGSIITGYYSETNGAGSMVISSSSHLAQPSTTLFGSNSTIYANWFATTDTIYTITLNNGNVVPDNATLDYIYVKNGTGFYSDIQCTTQITSLTPTPQKNMWSFKGFYSELDGAGNLYISKSGAFDSNYMTASSFSSHTVLHAYWLQIYTLTVYKSASLSYGSSSVTISGSVDAYGNAVASSSYSSAGTYTRYFTSAERVTINYYHSGRSRKVLGITIKYATSITISGAMTGNGTSTSSKGSSISSYCYVGTGATGNYSVSGVFS